MANEMIIKNIDSIMRSPTYSYPLNVAMAASWTCLHFKGRELKILDMIHISSLSDYFVLVTVDNVIQAGALASELRGQLRRLQMPVKAFEGSQESQWLLIDQGDVMIHIFVGEARTVYDLDGLWKEAKMISVPEDFYFSSTQTTSSLSGEAEQFVTSSEDYF